MNPPLPTPLLLPLLVAALALAAWLSWRGSAGLPASRRGWLLALRVSGWTALAALLLNPGQWIRPTKDRERPWLVLVDRSASMAQPLDQGNRADAAKSLAQLAAAAARKHGLPVRCHPFDNAPSTACDDLARLPGPTGTGSDLHGSLKRLVEEAAAAGESFAGVLALTDGRQTADPTDTDLQALALRLRSRQTPCHAVAIGADSPVRDLVIRATRPTVTVFQGQKARIPVAIETTGLGPQRPEILLHDDANHEIARLTVEASPGKTAFAVFEATAPPASTRWSLETAVFPEETNPGNNRSHVNLRLLDSKTRVFLAEGAPYWDSKFLAQLLRQQSQMDVHSVHRLSDERFFRIDSGQADPVETKDAIFPDSLEDLSRYDLVIFGRNADSFLTSSRLEALRSYVRDQGGAVLFARGKATTGNMPALESLEPVVWAATTTTATDFRFRPSADGEAAGLFGEALPPPDASLWNALPPLKDARQISLVKPFTRVLAEGVPGNASGQSGRFPTLLVRRYGQGVCGLVNGDGLWKWDFFPEARQLGNMYEDFWIQLIQWMASYSEFLPGQDFSLRLPALRGHAGVPVTAAMSFRGTGNPPTPVLRVESPSGAATDLKPAACPDPGGHPQWRASFTPDCPGPWKIRIVDSREKAPPAPEATFLIPPPPAESDNLAADPRFLANLTRASGGRLLTPADLPAFLESAFTPQAPSATHAAAVWQPAWPRWPFALLIALPLASEWFLRRRHGLA